MLAISCRDSKCLGSYYRRMDPRAIAPIRLVLGGGSLLNQVARDLRTATEAQLAPFDLTAQQAALLLTAARTPASPRQLTELLGTDTAGITRLLDRLEAKGFVTRGDHPEDRRAKVIELTPAGRALVPSLPPVFGRVTKQLLAGFSAAEIEQLSALLQRMRHNLTTEPASPVRAAPTPP